MSNVDQSPSFHLDRAWACAVMLGEPARSQAVESIAVYTKVPFGYVWDLCHQAVDPRRPPDWTDMTSWYESAEAYAVAHSVPDYACEDGSL